MKITFVGASHGVPEPHRKCSCILLEVGQQHYFIDMGCSPMNALITRNIPIESVKAAFFTHKHGDHTDGLLHWLDLTTWYFQQARAQIYLPCIEQAELACAWVRGVGAGEVLGDGDEPPHADFFEVKPGVIFDDGALKVTAVPTQHCDRSYAYWVEAEGKLILFTGDLAHPDKDFPALPDDRTVDLLVCEGAHFPVVDYLPHLQGKPLKQVVVTHYAPWNIPHAQALAQQLAPVPLTLANDDMELRL